MGLLRYSEGELRELLKRAVRIRWPDEDLVVVTACRVEAGTDDGLSTSWEPSEVRTASEWRPARAFLAATRRRLIYQERATQSVLLRAIAAGLVATAIVMLFAGPGLARFAAICTAALVVWCVAKVTEVLTVGGTSIEFHRVETVDWLDQTIGGTIGSGAVYRLRVPDATDFGAIASLLGGRGFAA
jgi:hypothetical protein